MVASAAASPMPRVVARSERSSRRHVGMSGEAILPQLTPHTRCHLTRLQQTGMVLLRGEVQCPGNVGWREVGMGLSSALLDVSADHLRLLFSSLPSPNCPDLRTMWAGSTSHYFGNARDNVPSLRPWIMDPDRARVDTSRSEALAISGDLALRATIRRSIV